MRLYITGGGTGGHVTPGLAIARYFEKRQPETVIRFAGSARGIENKLVPREGYPLDAIEIIGLSRSMSPKGILHNIKAAKLAVSAVAKAKKLLKAARPDCVIGCGGYASFAVVKAAQELGIPTVLLEVNALPGKVTQMLAKKADRVLVCFEQAKKLLGGDEKIILTGAPVRGEILAASREKARAKFGLGENDQLVVSFWGSMGAKYMNEHMAGTLALECKNGVSYHHVHATGAAARDWLPKMAREQGADFENHPNIQYRIHLRHGGPHGGGRPYRVPRRCGDARRAVHARPSGAARAVPLRRGEPSGEERARARVGRRLPRAARKGCHAAEAV